LTHTPDWQNHLNAIRDFLTRICNAHLTLKTSKCVVGSSTVPYLGHKVGDSKLEPKPELIYKIVEAPRPTTQKQLRSFFGLVGYYPTQQWQLH